MVFSVYVCVGKMYSFWFLYHDFSRFISRLGIKGKLHRFILMVYYFIRYWVESV